MAEHDIDPDAVDGGLGVSIKAVRRVGQKLSRAVGKAIKFPGRSSKRRAETLEKLNRS